MREDQRNWDAKISEVEEMINTTVHASTGFSPYRILNGHEKVAKGDHHRIEREEKEISEGEREHIRAQINEKVFRIVEENLKKSYDKNLKNYNLRHKKFAPTYHIGQRVFKRNFKQSSAVEKYNAKYGPVYTPCVIVAKRGTNAYGVADEEGKNLGVFSAADLRPDDSNSH